MSRRDNAAARCARCRLHENICICALLPSVATRTRVVLVLHRLEARKPTNTGQLATACLPNSEVLVRGGRAASAETLTIEPGTRPVLLFPHEDATPLGALALDERPVTLIVPDGTWRQASKVRARVPGLREVPCVTLPPGEPSAYRLRAEAHEGNLATFEAIARALGVLEGAHVRRALEDAFRAMVERTLWARGAIGAGEVAAGVPAEALARGPGLRRRAGDPPGALLAELDDALGPVPESLLDEARRAWPDS